MRLRLSRAWLQGPTGRNVNNKGQKIVVNPLTRPASRSVMQPSYSVAAC
jgi:hypothetical protein